MNRRDFLASAVAAASIPGLPPSLLAVGNVNYRQATQVALASQPQQQVHVLRSSGAPLAWSHLKWTGAEIEAVEKTFKVRYSAAAAVCELKGSDAPVRP